MDMNEGILLSHSNCFIFELIFHKPSINRIAHRNVFGRKVFKINRDVTLLPLDPPPKGEE